MNTCERTRVWRADSAQKTGFAEITILDESSFDQRWHSCARTLNSTVDTSFGKLNCRVGASIHAAKQFRERGCSNEPILLVSTVQEYLRIAAVADAVLETKPYRSVLILDADLKTVYILTIRPSEEGKDVLIRTYFYMGFNSHKKFYLEDAETICVKVENKYGLDRSIPRNRLIFGIENIPEIQLNTKYK